MKKPLEKILIVDVESTCDEPAMPADQISEIIEIGICELFNDGSIRKSRSIIIKPQHSKVSEFCKNLTTLTQETVDRGISFAQAAKLLKEEFGTKNYTWASFGDYDRKMFEKMSNLFKVDYPFGPRHINIKTLFALQNKLEKEVEVKGVLNMLGLEFKGTHHRGIDDAINIAQIAKHVLGW